MTLTQQHWSSFISEPVCVCMRGFVPVFCGKPKWTQETLFILLACLMILSTISIFHTEIMCVCFLDAGTEQTVHPCRGWILSPCVSRDIADKIVLNHHLRLCPVDTTSTYSSLVWLELLNFQSQLTQVPQDAVKTLFHQLGVGDVMHCSLRQYKHVYHQEFSIQF